jgi:hypothetical protein
MKKCTLLVVLLLVFAANVFAQSSSISTNEINPNSPVYTGKSPQTNANLDVLGALLRNHNIDSVTPGNAVSYGVVWTGSYYIVSQFNANKFYKISSNWVKLDSFAITGGTGSFRDMAFAKGLLWGVNTTGQIFGVDTGTKAVVKTITTSLVQLRAITWDPYRNGFWVGTTNFTGPLRFVDTLGAATLSITTPASGLYSAGYEDMGSQATSFLWIGTDQTPSVPSGTALVKYNAGTLAIVGTPLNIAVPLTVGAPNLASGGGEVVSNLIPGKRTWVGCVQGTPDRVIVVELSDLPAPPVSGDSVLVIMNDSTLATNLAIRKADRDTLKKYLPMLAGKIRYMTKDSTTALPSLTNYGTVIVQETGFDMAIARGLSSVQRGVIKTWLATGTPSAKKNLLLIGADMGYNYDRATSPFQDFEFSRTYGGFSYMMDNGGPINFNAVINVASGSSDSLTTGATNYWPDGCTVIDGGAAFNRYRQRIDTLAGITKIGTGSVVVSLFQDPRYYVGSGGAGASDFGFKRVLKNALAFIKTNGGTITGVTSSSTIADKYNLSQNYPNPFNPTTKISFAIPTSGFVTLKVYNIMGQEVMSLVNQNMNSGVYTADFNGAALSSGAYFYRLEAGSFVETKKMLLVK